MDYLGSGNRAGASGLFKESPEDKASAAGVTPVEPECELLQVGLQVSRVDAALVCAKKPPFEEARHPVNARHHNMSQIFRCINVDHLAIVAVLRHIVIAAPPIGDDDGTRRHNLAHERDETGARGVGDITQTYPSEAFRLFEFQSDHDDALLGSPSTLSSMVDAPDQRLVDLDIAVQCPSVSSHHRYPVSLQHGPGSAVVHTDTVGKRCSGQAILGSRQLPGCQEPDSQGRARLIEDRACRGRRLVSAGGTDKATSGMDPRLSGSITCGTTEPQWPANLLKECLTGIVVGEPCEKILQERWVVTTSGQGRGFYVIHPYI